MIVPVAVVCAVVCALLYPPTQMMTGEQILKRVDENIESESKVSVGTMRIQQRREVRTVRMKSWARGLKSTFTEFLAPPRDRGTKMLKLDDQLWMYTPSTDRTILISGHMLRQSVMGSDLSYEDLLEDPALGRMYAATVSGEETVINRPCWVLNLVSKGGDVSYHARRVWVDKERYLVLKEERFARSGKLLKTTLVNSVSRVEGRWVASDVMVRDALKGEGGTQFILESVDFNEDIPDHYFTKAALRR